MSEVEKIEQTETQDKYRFVIMALSFLVLFATMGIRGSFGTYVTAWENTFSVDRLSVSFVSFISLCIYGLSMVIAGRLSDKYGPKVVLVIGMLLVSICLIASFLTVNLWHMILLYGILGSIGFGFGSNVPISVAIVRWFKGKKGLAISFVVLGMAVGPMIFTPLNIFLLDRIGWKLMFVMYGTVYLVLFIPLLFVFFQDNPPEEVSRGIPSVKQAVKRRIDKNQSVKKESFILTIFKQPITWLIMITYFICGFTDVGLIQTHLVPLGEGRGYSSTLIANAIFLYGVVNVIGTLGVGYITDKFSNKKILMALFAIRITALVILISFNHQSWLLAFALLYGLTDIASIAPFTVLCSKIYGANTMGSAFGTISFFHQIGAAAGSIVPGYLYSLSLNYHSTLITSSVILVLGIIFFLFINENKQVRVVHELKTS